MQAVCRGVVIHQTGATSQIKDEHHHIMLYFACHARNPYAYVSAYAHNNCHSCEKKRLLKKYLMLSIPLHPRAAIPAQMLWGLGYMHFENRLHRDIKPQNVLINRYAPLDA